MEPSSRADILHVVEAFGGGVAAAVRDYVRDLPEARHHIVCRLRPEADALDSSWREEFASVTPIHGGHLSALRTVRGAIRSLRPQVVHSHSSYAGVWARVAAAGMSDVRSVYTPHAWAFAREDRSGISRAGYRAVERTLIRRTDVLAGCSRAELGPARTWGAAAELVYIPNIAHSAAPAQPLVEWDAEHGPLLVGSGRLAQQKDPLWFRDAVAALRAEGFAVRALWIGGGDEDLKRELVAAGIGVTGWVGPEDVQRFLAQADLYLHTAAWEGFPITVLEAEELGRPVLVRGIQAFDEVQMPVVLAAPQDLVRHWEGLRSVAARRELVEQQRIALRENTPEVQHDRLARAYGIEVQPWGAAEDWTGAFLRVQSRARHRAEASVGAGSGAPEPGAG